MHEITPPSPWIAENQKRLDNVSTPGRVLDLACGRGRHARLLAARGEHVLAVDRDQAALAALEGEAGIETLYCDLESGTPWPFAGEAFRGLVITNYLHRPTLGRALGLVARGGLLLYETFGAGNERFGRPANPDFLAQPGEIAAAARAAGFGIEEEFFGEVAAPRAAILSRVAARKLP
jgi:SAM-dependent methyltransferase